jgi:hypothetical protein
MKKILSSNVDMYNNRNLRQHFQNGLERRGNLPPKQTEEPGGRVYHQKEEVSQEMSTP